MRSTSVCKIFNFNVSPFKQLHDCSLFEGLIAFSNHWPWGLPYSKSELIIYMWILLHILSPIFSHWLSNHYTWTCNITIRYERLVCKTNTFAKILSCLQIIVGLQHFMAQTIVYSEMSTLSVKGQVLCSALVAYLFYRIWKLARGFMLHMKDIQLSLLILGSSPRKSKWKS